MKLFSSLINKKYSFEGYFPKKVLKRAHLLRDRKACPHLNLLSNNSAVSFSPLSNKKTYQLK